MLAYSISNINGTIELSCSDNRTIKSNSWEDISSFLLEPTDMAVVFNIDKFVDIITSTLPKKEQKSIQQNDRTLTHDRRKVYYQPGRMFGLNHINFYGLSRYADTPVDSPHRLLELGQQVIEAFKVFGIEPTKLTSPVAVYADVLSKVNFPRACDLPASAFDLIDQCSRIMSQEWREVYQLGHWNAGEIWDYDISGAYPGILARLPDITDAKFFDSKVMPQKYTWGLLRGFLDIRKDVTPFEYGKHPAIITTDQLWFVNRYHLGAFKMEQGWFFHYPHSFFKSPFEDTTNALYSLRQHNNPLVSKIAKGIAVGIGGRLAQTYDDGKLGEDFNSIYSVMMTTRCSTKVADFIYRNQMENDVVSVLVDGVLATKKLELPEGGMGKWRRNPDSPVLVLSLLYQWLADKRPANMAYPEIMSLISESPKSFVYGEVDFKLLEYNRRFENLPKNGQELVENRYKSHP